VDNKALPSATRARQFYPFHEIAPPLFLPYPIFHYQNNPTGFPGALVQARVDSRTRESILARASRVGPSVKSDEEEESPMYFRGIRVHERAVNRRRE